MLLLRIVCLIGYDIFYWYVIYVGIFHIFFICGGLLIIFIILVPIQYMFYFGASKALNLCFVRGENPPVV